MAGARTAARISARHLEGRLFPHELLAIHLKGRAAGYLVLAVSAAVPLLFWSPGASPSPCGDHGGEGPHAAWFRCTISRVESQSMSDFPTLRYLATISERYQQAIERDDPQAIRATEDELFLASGEPSLQAQTGGRRVGCPTSVIAFCD